MPRRKTLTDAQVKKLKPDPAKRLAVSDPECSGHYVRVTPTGAKSYCAVAREPLKKRQIWTTIGSTDHFTIEEAREQAREIVKRTKAGLPPREPPAPPPDTFREIAEGWMTRSVERRGLRTAKEYRRILDRYVLPVLGDRPVGEIRRGDVTHLLDLVEDGSGPRQADAV